MVSLSGLIKLKCVLLRLHFFFLPFFTLFIIILIIIIDNSDNIHSSSNFLFANFLFIHLVLLISPVSDLLVIDIRNIRRK